MMVFAFGFILGTAFGLFGVSLTLMAARADAATRDSLEGSR
jgi:hypothetical protein